MFDHAPSRLPPAVGVGFKAQHFSGLTTDRGPVRWVEIHAENFLGQGGRPLAQLRALAADMPISVHGVGLSIGGDGPLDDAHLARLSHLCAWLGPASFSEHLAWSTHDTTYLNDLLPLPYTAATLARVAAHVDRVQQALRRPILIENPATYLTFAETEMDEIAFLTALAARTGCGLLLDVNNVHVACTNSGADPQDYIRRFPLHLVGEIHLGGHAADTDDHGAPLLIDTHGTAVADPVWDLFALTLRLGGSRPVLIEWDNDVPDWPVLSAEAARAAALLEPVPS
ncbi:MAG: MNIO family bufferin maturase [Gemmobacter sp.]